MPRFEVKQTSKLYLTSYSGLALIGQCCQAAQVDTVIDPRLPVSQGMRTSDIVKSMVGLLSLGKSDFDAIEAFRSDRFFKGALGLSKVPGSVWMRQRLDAKSAELRKLTDELSLRLLERTAAPITAHHGYVCCDIDTFVMDNSDTSVNGDLKLTHFSTKQRFKTDTPQIRILRGIGVLEGGPKAQPERCLCHAALIPSSPCSSPEPSRLGADV